MSTTPPDGQVSVEDATSFSATSEAALHIPPLPERPVPSIPDHQLLRLIGRGSYGEVWLARSATGSLRAVKIVYRDSFDHDRPYEREFDGLKKFEPLSHARESQVDIFHVGRNDAAGFFYYIMELADDANVAAKVTRLTLKPGTDQSLLTSAATYQPRTLKHDLRTRGALPVSECIEIALSLTRALEHLHSHGLVHRDIKPSNIIFVNSHAKLADIGLVTSVDATRSFVGTDGYIPPEGPGTPQADLYSLGKVLYELVTGKDRLDFPELPADWRTRPDFDQLLEFNEILTKLCDGEPSRRYQTAEKMHAELELLQRGESVKRKRTTERRWAVGKKIAIAGILLSVLASGSTILLPRFTRSDLSGDGPPSKNQDADNLCAEGLLIVRGDNYADFGKAYTNFQKAIKLDPGFARPYAGLLELLREWHPEIKSMTQEDLRDIADKLEKLGPNLAVAHLARALLSYRALDFPQARKSIRKAIETDPKYEYSRTEYGFMLVSWGWPLEARKQLEISLSLAPSKVTIYCWIGHTYRAERDYTNAIAWYQKTLDYRSHHAWAYGALKETYEALGDYGNAIENAEKESLAHGGDPISTKQSYDVLRRAFRDRGTDCYYQQQWEWAEKDPNEESYWKACLQMRLGNTDAALDWLKKSVQAKLRNGNSEGNLKWLLVHECWDPVRNDPRFKQVLDQTTFSQVMSPRK